MCIDIFLMCDMVVSISKKYWYKRTYMCLAEQDYTQIVATKSTKLCEMTQRYSPVFPALSPDKTPATSSSR